MDEDKRKDSADQAKDEQDDPGRDAYSKARERKSSKKKSEVLDEGDEGDEGDEDDEGDENDENDEDGAEAVREAVEQKPRKRIISKKKPPKPVVKQPSELPLPPRNTEILAGFASAIAGLLAFWLGSSIYTDSIAKHNVNYFSHSAWAWLIAYFFIIVSAFNFIRLERPDESKKPSAIDSPKDKDIEAKERPRAKLDRLGVVLTAVICGPFYWLFWWKAYEVWKASYATERPVMWLLFIILFAFSTFGAYYGLRPPSEDDEIQRRMPTRRIMMLLMTPFLLVYGMIYLAGLYPPWPT